MNKFNFFIEKGQKYVYWPKIFYIIFFTNIYNYTLNK